MKCVFRIIVLLAFALSFAATADAAAVIRIALIDPLSGPFANIGNGALHGFTAEFERINEQGGALGRPFELVAFDSKSNAQEGALQVQAAIDQGIRFILQGSGSNVGHAVSDAVARYNARHPDKPVLYLNHGALDPALTEEKCHFWHFRFVAHGHMIMQAATDALARRSARRVYLINQDYAWGQSVAKDAKEMLPAKRSNIEIVGEVLHPLGKVKDFAPYVAQIKASGADAVVTGNWGSDLALLIKASKETDLPVEIYAPIAGLQGAATMMGESGAERVRAVMFWHPNIPGTTLLAHAEVYRRKYKDDWNWLPMHLAPEYLVRAIRLAQSTDPLKVARALEGMKYAGPTGDTWMRAADHQLMMPVYETVFTKAGTGGVKYDAEGTGFGWKTEGKLESVDNTPALRCTVQRP